MELPLLNKIPASVTQALYYTLAHSLWQGLIAAAIAGVIIAVTRRSSAATRYNLLTAVFGIFAFSMICTFIHEVKIISPETNIMIPAAEVTAAGENTAAVFLNPAAGSSLKNAAISFFNKNANVIVMIWLLIVLIRSTQLISGLNSIHYLRNRSLTPVSEDWKTKIDQLAAKLGITQLVQLAESGIAKVPMVTGHLKPLILLPVGLLTSLPPAETEAILIHELAHIKRRDYLVNILQSMMEIIFFFNPAVLWLSALIKAERENCCDDIALEQTGNKVNYIRALVSCREYQLQAPAYAMALRSSKGSLTQRVKRIFSGSNHSLNPLERSLLVIALITTGAAIFMFSNTMAANKKQPTGTVVAQQQRTVTTTTTSVTTGGNDASDEDPKMQAVPPEAARQDSIAAAEQDSIAAAENIPSESEPIHSVKEINDIKQDALMAEQKAKADAAKALAYVKKLAHMVHPQSLNRSAKSVNINLSNTPVNVSVPLNVSVKERIGPDKEQLLQDLLEDKLIDRKEAIASFKLSTKEFIINGVRQSVAVFKKYRNLYTQSTGKGEWSWYYNYDTSSEKK